MSTAAHDYRVQLGAPDGGRTLTVRATNWLEAWRAATGHTTGGEPRSLEGATVDLRHDETVVLDHTTRSPVHIRRLETSQSGARSSVDAQPGLWAAVDGPSLSWEEASGASRTIGSTGIYVPPGAGRVLTEAAPDSAHPDASIEQALEDVFLDVAALHDHEAAMPDVLDFVLELIGRHVPAKVTALLFATDAGDRLYVASASGAGRRALVDAELPIDTGIPATAMRAGVAIAVPSAARDPRATPALLKLLGVDDTALCAAPIQHAGRAFGVLVLARHGDGAPGFSVADTSVLAYVGEALGLVIQQRMDAVG